LWSEARILKYLWWYEGAGFGCLFAGASQRDGKWGRVFMRRHSCSDTTHRPCNSSSIFDPSLLHVEDVLCIPIHHIMASLDSKDDSVPPVPNETAISAREAEQQRLCDRCCFIDLDHLSTGSPPISIPVPSLEPGCCYCDNFRMLVSEETSGCGACTVEDIGIGVNSAGKIHLDFLVDKGGSAMLNEHGFYSLIPVEQQRKEFRQTAGNYLDAEPSVFSLIQSSLETCRKSHSDCHEKRFDVSVPLKVVDCQSRTLCTIDPDATYAALSYVWGNVPAQPLLNPQTLLLPKTIEDALSVCRRVGIQYIWVDRYCIDQENPQEKHALISQMDKIYQGAELTIIAAVGENPDYGLPGVNGTPRHHLVEFRTVNSSFTASRSPERQIRSSTWSTRGWTYQEVLLSRRRLYFTDLEVIFECQSLTAQESVSEDSWSSSSSAYQFYSRSQPNQMFWHIYELLFDYCNLSLTYSEDAIRGIEAIIRSFQFIHDPYWPFGASEGSQTIIHFYGIPCTSYEPSRNLSFLTSLLWQGCNLRISAESMQKFPSWSWASTKTSAQGWISFPKLLFYDTEEEVAFPLSINLLHEIRGEESLSNFEDQDDYMAYHPWFEIDTWLLNGQSQHPVPSRFLLDNDKTSETPETDSIIAVNIITHKNQRLSCISLDLLLVQQTALGNFRRAGYYDLYIFKKELTEEMWEMDLHSSMALVKAATLNKVQELVPDMEWEIKERTVRLV
jgi:hypothetical protein